MAFCILHLLGKAYDAPRYISNLLKALSLPHSFLSNPFLLFFFSFLKSFLLNLVQFNFHLRQIQDHLYPNLFHQNTFILNHNF